MTTLGYKLSSEEHSAPQLVENAIQAEEAGFAFLAISDHYHPVAGRAGAEPVRVGSFGRRGGGHGADPGRNGRDLPDGPDPSRDCGRRPPPV
jgi:alkanesulfonate monooxygenase SsuD/methylene tetrahydromethanopterin reductase-like flavin-dependent oxidoreductase (luciferase family)